MSLFGYASDAQYLSEINEGLIMAKEKTVTVHTNVDKNVLDLFDKMYPTCRTRLIQNALYLCTTNKAIFDKIFFYELLKDSSLAL